MSETQMAAAPAPFAMPEFALIVLVGASGSGKSSLAARLFDESEIVSSDRCRFLVSDDETDQSATGDAFDLARHWAGLRLKRRKLTVIDSTAARPEDRKALIELARAHHAPTVAIVLDIDPAIAAERNESRPNRPFGAHVVRNHARLIRRGLKQIKREGFSAVRILKTPEEIAALTLTREPLWTDKRGDAGPFDVIGDVHGCFDELTALLTRLGYTLDPYTPGEAPLSARHPAGRRALFVGDLTDRGPRNVDVLRLVMGMAEEGSALSVVGNHDFKLLRWLRGQRVTLNHGLEITAAELEAASEDFRARTRDFIAELRSHYWLDHGRLAVAHAGVKAEMIGRGSPQLRQFCMFGETTGEVDGFGLPVRLDWARDYRGEAAVVYGHTPAAEAEWLNNTLCVDQGCVFGGALTALRWPEKEIVSEPARAEYAKPAKPMETRGALSAQQAHDRLLFVDDHIGKRRIEAMGRTIVIPEENAAAAFENLSRFGVDPRWLIYLPPTMSPCPTAPDGPMLERPEEALAAFRAAGLDAVIAEEKHMGSRALIVAAKDAAAAQARFGVEDGKAGVIYTRTGRPFFRKPADEAGLVAYVREAIAAAGLWDELESDWLLLDAEITPWSAKAEELLRRQYGPTATAARAHAEALTAALGCADDAIEGLAPLREAAARAARDAEAFEAAVLRYCWRVETLEDHRIAPFHILAAEGRVFDEAEHVWHMRLAERLAEANPVMIATGWSRVPLGDAEACAALVERWAAHTAAGGEGYVIKPERFAPPPRPARAGDDGAGAPAAVQPAMKVRGREYLRLIYGPSYDAPETLARLRQRGLGRKQSLALREFALGREGLRRFVAGAPLARVHDCVLAVLALESEPVDPRL